MRVSTRIEFDELNRYIDAKINGDAQKKTPNRGLDGERLGFHFGDK